jgi:hypothetical protein
MNKNNSHAFVNQLLIYTLVMICFSGSIGLGTVWLRHQISVTANTARVLESRIAEIERHIAETNTQIAGEQSPDVLARRNREWALGLVPPQNTQVVRVTGSPEQRLAAKNNADVFSSESVKLSPVTYRGREITSR